MNTTKITLVEITDIYLPRGTGFWDLGGRVLDNLGQNRPVSQEILKNPSPHILQCYLCCIQHTIKIPKIMSLRLSNVEILKMS